MRKNIYNFIIIFLVGVAFYQTYTLWFINLSNPSASINQNINEDDKKLLLTPYRISLLNGEDTYNNFYDNQNSELLLKIEEDFKKGLEIGEETNYDLFSKTYDELIVLNYTFLFNQSDFKEVLDMESSRLNIIDFDYIFLAFESENTYICFYNSYEDMYSYAVYPNTKLKTQLITYKQSELLYTSSDMFSFTPTWNENLEYELLETDNPYESNGEIHISGIESKINYLFNNPLSKNQSVQNETGAITFSDNNTIVRYYPNDIFEYRFYNLGSQENNANLLDSFKVATSFIRNDETIINNYFLKDYTIENDETTFYFDYSIGDFPLLLPQSYKQVNDMSSFIEVVVHENTVVSFKKVPFTFTLSGATAVGNLSYFDILSQNQFESNNGVMGNALAYKVEKVQNIGLTWFIFFENNEYTQPFTYN